ncbi:MAG: hypothetical protein KA319_02010 [Ferruginibacter sp.]|nr:hypothetical protein [Ferruginibacter sp.]
MLVSCLRVPTSTLSRVKNIDFVTLSNKLLTLTKGATSDTSFIVSKIKDTVIVDELRKLNVTNINIIRKLKDSTALDSIISFIEYNRNLSLRLYKMEKYTTITYDFAFTPRDLYLKKDFWVSETKKVKERVWISKNKEPGTR